MVAVKRIIGCVLALTFLLSSVALSEVDFDASQYSLEELVVIRAAVEAEIDSRVSSATATLLPGRYVAGVDIKAGSYILIGLMDKAPNGYTPQALVAESMERKYNYIDDSYMDEGRKWHFSIQDGMVLEIRYGECVIQQAPPFLFAP